MFSFRIETKCGRRDLNPHGQRPPPPQDGVSANSTTSASYSKLKTTCRRYLEPGEAPNRARLRSGKGPVESRIGMSPGFAVAAWPSGLPFEPCSVGWQLRRWGTEM